jgi:hypothetical protein
LEAFQGWLLLFKDGLQDAIFGAPYFSHAFFGMEALGTFQMQIFCLVGHSK